MNKVFLVLLMATATAFAVQGSGWGGVWFSGTLVDVEGINQMITARNHEQGGTQTLQFSSPLYMLGGQAGLNLGYLGLSLGGGGLLQRTYADSLGASIGYGTFYGDAGFQWKPLDWLWIRPQVGLGGAWFQLDLYGRYGGFGQPPADTINNPYRHIAWAGQINADAGLEIQFNLALSYRSFMGISLNPGYSYPLHQSPWYDQEGRIVEWSEEFGIHGPYLRLTLNFGGSGSCLRGTKPDDNGWEEDF